MVDGTPALIRATTSSAESRWQRRSYLNAGAGGLGLGALGVQLLSGAEAAVGLALGQEPLRVGLVAGPVLSLKQRALVPGDAEPGEPVEDDPGVRLGAALAVGVLDAEDELSAVCRAKSQLNSAVRAPPTCRYPVGEGANRTRGELSDEREGLKAKGERRTLHLSP